MRRLVGLVSAAALVLTSMVPTMATAAAAPSQERSQRAASVTVTGNGFGHGHGLSQWGAKSAAEEGLDHDQILGFYYPGLEDGSSGGKVSILISADTSTDVQVRDRSGLVVKSLADGRTYELSTEEARWWRITPAKRGTRSAVSVRTKGSKTWARVRTVPGQAQFSAGGKPITLRTPTETRSYRGVLRSASPAGPGPAVQRDTVNVVSMENYLKGVVPREVPALWPQEAVRSQAVAARTYAAFERRRPLAPHYQICDTSSCQVYGGHTDEHPGSNQAVKATRKQVLLSEGQPAFTQFSASNGGYTSAGAFDYLPAKADPYDTAYRGWSTTITDAAVRAALPGVGTLRSVEVLRRDGKGAFGGRVTSIKVMGSDGSSTVTGDQFRSYFGLRSTMFKVG
ncbi:MAG: SpoIID/LytB domain-containing protein [Nocardioides sp.]